MEEMAPEVMTVRAAIESVFPTLDPSSQGKGKERQRNGKEGPRDDNSVIQSPFYSVCSGDSVVEPCDKV